MEHATCLLGIQVLYKPGLFTAFTCKYNIILFLSCVRKCINVYVFWHLGMCKCPRPCWCTSICRIDMKINISFGWSQSLQVYLYVCMFRELSFPSRKRFYVISLVNDYGIGKQRILYSCHIISKCMVTYQCMFWTIYALEYIPGFLCLVQTSGMGKGVCSKRFQHDILRILEGVCALRRAYSFKTTPYGRSVSLLLLQQVSKANHAIFQNRRFVVLRQVLKLACLAPKICNSSHS